MGEERKKGSKVNLHTVEEEARVRDRGYISPPTDIFETREGLHIVIEIPGVSEDCVSITVSGPKIVIEGVKKMEDESGNRYSRVERNYGMFQKNFEVVGAFNTSLTSALLKDGLLKIFVPRCEEKRGKEIHVKVNVDKTGEGDLG